ncbi:MAG: type II toxin-antitoxin system HicA family toxin [Saprospiraceae bacterium]
MKLPRNISGAELVKLLAKNFNYEITRQKGSHIRMTTREPSEHHITISYHAPLKVGTLSAILADVAEHVGLSREELTEILFG